MVTCHSDGFYGYGKASTKVMAKKNASYMLICEMIKKYTETILNLVEHAVKFGMDFYLAEQLE